MTPEHLRILKTLPKVIEAVKAFQAEADELMALLGKDAPPDRIDADAARVYAQRERERLSGGVQPPAPPVLATLRAVPPPAPDPEAEVTRRAAEAELLRRKGSLTPEERDLVDQADRDAFLKQSAGERKSLLAAILPGGTS